MTADKDDFNYCRYISIKMPSSFFQPRSLVQSRRVFANKHKSRNEEAMNVDYEQNEWKIVSFNSRGKSSDPWIIIMLSEHETDSNYNYMAYSGIVIVFFAVSLSGKIFPVFFPHSTWHMGPARGKSELSVILRSEKGITEWMGKENYSISKLRCEIEISVIWLNLLLQWRL